jgi:hypothetical protein
VRLSPNVEWVRYDRRGDAARRRRDLVVRLTFYWIF